MQNAATNIVKGSYGERMASGYLQKKGYEILHTNWTCRWGELDIIAQKNGRIVFTEVKYRTSLYYGHGFEAINYYKLKHLHRTIKIFLTQNEMHELDWQLDVVCVTKLGQRFKVDHFEAIGF